MKKTYEKPILAKASALSRILAGISRDRNGSAPG